MTDLPDVFIRAHPRHPWSIRMRTAIAGCRCANADFGRSRFEIVRITSPNNGAAPNRRLRSGLVPSSWAPFGSQVPAVGELGRWA